ncbi:MAG: diaminopimelate decarboxylase, partial [Pseudomonadota bacterium]
MNHFELHNGVLHAEQVALPDIAAAVGTPVYVYSRATFERHAQVFRNALSGLDNPHIAFAVKANPNLAVLKILAKQGYGADVVSGGELDRALAAGMKPEDIVFSGVGKTADEMIQGLQTEIGQFNIESEEEGRELSTIAEITNRRAAAVLRINPDVDAGTHGKISTGKADNKFGVGLHKAVAIYSRLAALPGLNMRGVALHIGSQLTSLDPLETAFKKIGALLRELREAGHKITHVDLGGGLGVRYHSGDNPPEPADYGAMVERVTKGWDVRLMFEPGRVIAGNAGVLLTRVIRVKPGGGNLPFAIVDAAMNDLARPA